jgi:ABC-type transport system involved in multi-copper enzyme maturation permease subunit
MSTFTTVFKKELVDQILSPKFLIVSLLCLVLIPASLLLNYASYQTAAHDYDTSRKDAKNSTTVYREPSTLATFGIGLESVLPQKVTFSKYQTDARGTQAQNEVLGNINGRIDFVVITSFLLGLFAILYAGTMVCGEKESGTLKLVLSNRTTRSTILAAKYLGGFSVLLIPFAVSTLVGVLLLLFEGFPLFVDGDLVRILSLVALSVLYLSALFSLGLLVSTRTHRASLALLASFFVWIFLTFVIPKASEPVAGLIRRVPSEEVMKAKRAQVRAQLEKEKGRALSPLVEKYLPNNSQGKWDWEAYVKARGPVAQPYEERIDQTLQAFDADYEREKAARRTLSLNIARLSPASSYTQAALDFCHTGVADLENFSASLRAHDIQLTQAVFKYAFQDTISSDDGRSSRSMAADSTPEGGVKYPQFRYEFPSFEDTLKDTAPDIILLALFNLIFFAAAYYSFVRYDVR